MFQMPLERGRTVGGFRATNNFHPDESRDPSRLRTGKTLGAYVYILASGPHGTLYTGHTQNLAKRVLEHREKVVKGFTAKYDVTRLVWFEYLEERENAFRRERRIKDWRRAWKIELIEAENPTWRDLYPELNMLISFD